MKLFLNQPILCAFALLSLAACDRINYPHPWPSSYAHHGGEDGFNSPPGHDASAIGYAYEGERNDQILKRFQRAARHMIGTVEAETGLRPTTLYLERTQTETAFTNAFDHAMRQVLMEKGYDIKNAAQEFSARLAYTILPYHPLQATDHGDENYKIQAALYHGAEEPFKVTQGYNLPSYGAKSFKMGLREKIPETKTQRTRNRELQGNQ